MGLFTKHDETSAPEGATEVLAMVKERYGFIPNLAAYVSESPAALGAVLKLIESFEKSTLTAQEQQVVLLTVSSLNGCGYCKTVHTALGKMSELDAATIQAVIALNPLADKKLNALRDFTRLIVEEKGWLDEQKIQQFLSVGYTRAQVFEVIMGVSLKTMTNYSNHLAGAEPNEEFITMAGGKAAA